MTHPTLRTALLGIAALLVTAPSTALGETITGKLNGHTCAHQRTTCPLDKLDPHVALEPDFVLMRNDGEYLFLPNLPRDIKIRHVLQEVRIVGAKHPRYNSVDVDRFYVKQGDQYALVWSRQIQALRMQEMYGEGMQWAGQVPR